MRGIASLPPRAGQKRFAKWLVPIVVLLHFGLGGCATWQPPEEVSDVAWKERAVTETVRGVRLSAAVLSAAESRQLFGADVNAEGIQPVWIEVQNPGPDALWLLRAGTDPDYFSPLEVAWSFHAPFADRRNAAIDRHFYSLDFENPIHPNSTRSGVIFTNPHHRTRVLNVDLLGQRRLIPFTLFLSDPDNPPDENALKTVARFAEAYQRDLEHPDELRNALGSSPCCAEGADRASIAEPVNVVLIGELDDVAAAFVRRGYRSDRMAPDDDQLLFGRRPDFVLRKAGQGGVPAQWIRGWVAPFRYRGQPVFLVQTGRPVGGRFAVADNGEMVLHADVDEVRNLVVQDLLYSGGVARLGFVGGAGSSGIAHPTKGSAKNSYHTDGLRAVMFLATRPRAISDVEILDWVPALERQEAEVEAGWTNAR